MKLPLRRRLQAVIALAALLFQPLAFYAPAQSSAGVPQLLNYQGRVTVGGVNHQGAGWFKFSLVDGGGSGGPGGPGGPGIGIIAGNGSTLTQSGNTFTLGNAGAGGLDGFRPGLFGTRAPSGAAGLQQNILTGVAP